MCLGNLDVGGQYLCRDPGLKLLLMGIIFCSLLLLISLMLAFLDKNSFVFHLLLLGAQIQPK